MFHYSIQFVPDGLLAVFTIHYDHGNSELDFVCTCTITKQQALNLIKLYNLENSAHEFWNTSVKWLPQESIIYKEQSSGKLLPVISSLHKTTTLLTQLADKYGHLMGEDELRHVRAISEIKLT